MAVTTSKLSFVVPAGCSYRRCPKTSCMDVQLLCIHDTCMFFSPLDLPSNRYSTWRRPREARTTPRQRARRVRPGRQETRGRTRGTRDGTQRTRPRGDAPRAGGGAGFVPSSLTSRLRRCPLARHVLRARCRELLGAAPCWRRRGGREEEHATATTATGVCCQRSEVGHVQSKQAPHKMKNGQQCIPC